jgi:hypothetical protein
LAEEKAARKAAEQSLQ